MGRVLPILFNTEMVRAILDGKKNVTRRTMNPQPLFYTGRKYIFDDDKCPKKWECCDNILETYKYQPGDILYVREAYCPNYFDKSIAGHRSGGMKGNTNAYRADYRKEIIGDVAAEPKWKPSIHMPKEAARIWLKVTDVRIEQLQDITEEQAKAEGVSKLYDDLAEVEYIDWAKRTGIYPKEKEDWGYKNYLWHGNFGIYGTGNKMSDAWKHQCSCYDDARRSFSSLWNTTVPLKDWDSTGWDANPWVWVIEFERCEKPERENCNETN